MNIATLPFHRHLVHPRTGKPLQAIGIRPDGRPVWPLMGGDGSEDDANDWAKVFEGQTPAQVRAALDDANRLAQEATNGASAWSNAFGDQSPEEVKKALEDSRRWETRAKAHKVKADQFDELARAVVGEDADLEAIRSAFTDISSERGKTAEVLRENAVLRNSMKLQANADRLIDSRSFMDTVKGLDPSASDFTEKITAAITKAVEDDPTLKTTGGTPRPARQQGTPSSGQTGSVQAGRDAYTTRHGKKS